jgi:hypothetical protein
MLPHGMHTHTYADMCLLSADTIQRNTHTQREREG